MHASGPRQQLLSWHVARAWCDSLVFPYLTGGPLQGWDLHSSCQWTSIQRRLHCLQNAHRTPGKRSGKAPVGPLLLAHLPSYWILFTWVVTTGSLCTLAPRRRDAVPRRWDGKCSGCCRYMFKNLQASVRLLGRVQGRFRIRHPGQKLNWGLWI